MKLKERFKNWWNDSTEYTLNMSFGASIEEEDEEDGPCYLMNPPIECKWVKTHKDAVLPKRNHDDPLVGDTGYDLTAVEDAVVTHDKPAVVAVGLKLAFVTPGFWFRFEPRSGLGFKHGIQPHLGIIDNPYRGDCGVKLYKLDDDPFTFDKVKVELTREESKIEIKKGDKIAQIIFYPLISAEQYWTTEVDETERGEKGFGSSD